MNPKVVLRFLFVYAVGAGSTLGLAASPMGTSFIYQGQLKRGGVPLDRNADLRFTLWDSVSGGAQIGTAQTRADHPIAGGLFTVDLDFGSAAFEGSARWLQVQVRVPPGVGSYVTLTPRQAILPAPYARCAAVAEGLELPFSRTVSSAAGAVDVTNSGSGEAARFQITNAASSANTLEVDNDGTGYAIYSTARDGHAVRAANTGSGGEAIYATATGTSAHAVAGWATGTNGYGVSGGTNGATGRGMYGYANSATGENYGVYAKVKSASGFAVYGEGPARAIKGVATADSGQGKGVIGITESTGGWGVHGEGPNRGVYGRATVTSGITRGVVGDTLSTTGRGVQGYASTTTGENVGVWGGSNSAAGTGVHGTNIRTGTSASLGGPDYGVLSDGDVIVDGGRLHVTGPTDVHPGGGGGLVIGPLTGSNIAVDGNEIMARNNGETATLYVNNDGGDVVFGGTIDIGYELVSISADNWHAQALCPAGKKVIGGGCGCGASAEVQNTHPNANGTGWACECTENYTYATAICARVK